MAIQGGTACVDEIQPILDEEGHGGLVFELPNPADSLFLNTVIH